MDNTHCTLTVCPSINCISIPLSVIDYHNLFISPPSKQQKNYPPPKKQMKQQQ